MRTLCLALILCAAVRGSALGAEEKKDTKKNAPKPVEAGRVYTQADLERVIQESKDIPVTPLPPAQPPAQTALPAPPAKEAKPAKAAESASFSNEDLERMFGKVEEKPAPDPQAGLPALPNAMAEVSDWQAQRTVAERRRDEAGARVQQLEGQIRDLEQRQAAVRNPLLPRPEPPAGLEAGWEKLDGAERVAALEARLVSLREQLATARQEEAKAAADLRSR
ncbi:MAG TPA: hypothetical protein VFV75_13765 [Candidatus Polarisedimenticolaceae bacterium]|nr:hypothetical protein [Candidatus Polarisedimenticolaceae bacterium]